MEIQPTNQSSTKIAPSKPKEVKPKEIVKVDNQITQMTASAPDVMLNKAQAVANVLAPLVEDKKLYTDIKGKKYVRAEGWTTMLAMLGIFPHVEYTKKLDTDEGVTEYEARVVLKTMNGEVMGSADAMCSSKERNWNDRDEYAIRSMAQTRATGKAARLAFGWIMALGGYEATPAEEMPKGGFAKSNKPASDKQKKLIISLGKGLTGKKTKAEVIKALNTVKDEKEFETLTVDKASGIIKQMMNMKEQDAIPVESSKPTVENEDLGF